MDELVVFCAKYLIYIEILAALAALFFSSARGRRRMLLLGVIGLPLTYIIGRIASLVWYDPRPFVSEGVVPLISHAADNGFPSDHSLLAFALAGAVGFQNKKWGAVLFLLAILIALGRVLAGIHHAVDVVGGALIALFSVFVAAKALRHFAPEYFSNFQRY